LIETYVDTSRFAGTCYKAANWEYLGRAKATADKKTDLNITGTKRLIYVQVIDKRFKKTFKPNSKRLGKEED
jgi:hypothetical protein